MNRVAAGLALLALGLAAPVAQAHGWKEEAVVIESDHPYPNGAAGRTWVYHKPDSEKVKLFFERIDLERHWDFLDIEDASGKRIQRLTGRAENFWTEEVPGDRITIRLTSDRSTNGYGFKVTKAGFKPVHREATVARLEVLHAGRPVELLRMTPSSATTLEVRFLSRDGRPVEKRDFDPRLETASGDPLVKAESAGPGQVRILAASQTVAELPVRLFDARQPDLEAKFLVTIERAAPPPVQTAPARLGILVPDGQGGTRLVDWREEIVLAVHDKGEDHLPFEIQALDASGHVIAPGRADLVVEANVTSWYGTLEKRCCHMYVFHSGALPKEDVRILAYDRNNPRVRAGLRIQTVQPHEPQQPRVSEVRLLVEGRRGWRPVRPDERFSLAVHGAGPDHLEFAVNVLDEHGNVLPPEAIQLVAQINVVAWYGSLEQNGNRFTLHSGALPKSGIRVTVFESSAPGVVGVLNVDTSRPTPCARCGRHHAHDDGCAAPPPEPRRVQIGGTYAIPGWAKSSQIMEGFYVSRTDVTPLRQIVLHGRSPFRVEEIAIRFKDGSRTVVSSPQRDFPSMTDVLFDVPAELQGRAVDQVEVKFRARGGTEILCYGIVGP